MNRTALALAALLVTTATTVEADPAHEEIRSLYQRFYTAQNARDLDRVRTLLLPDERFLWVSDGQSFWGPDAVLERMALFQRSPVWEVEPNLDRAVAVVVDEHTAFLHLPLVLRLGSLDAPAELPFLVSVLGTETAQGWRIAALFTTTEKQP